MLPRVRTTPRPPRPSNSQICHWMKNESRRFGIFSETNTVLARSSAHYVWHAKKTFYWPHIGRDIHVIVVQCVSFCKKRRAVSTKETFTVVLCKKTSRTCGDEQYLSRTKDYSRKLVHVGHLGVLFQTNKRNTNIQDCSFACRKRALRPSYRSIRNFHLSYYGWRTVVCELILLISQSINRN